MSCNQSGSLHLTLLIIIIMRQVFIINNRRAYAARVAKLQCNAAMQSWQRAKIIIIIIIIIGLSICPSLHTLI